MKRVLAWLLMLALCLPPTAQAEEGGFVRSASFAIPSAWGSKTAELPLDERWFMEKNTQYHHGLARVSLGMAVSAFRGSAAAPDAPIRAFFSQLGFAGADDPDRADLPGVSVWDYEAMGEETVGTAVAWRYLTCFESPVPLVAVAVSGGYYGDEWANNLDFGLAGDHTGFARAGKKVVDRIARFEEENGLAGESCRYWLAGFGRGGAVCQAAAKLLEKDKTVFCYTFASPAAVLREGEAGESGAFNIVSLADPLCFLPFSAWGFSHWGHTLYLPSSLNAAQAYAPLLREYARVFGQFSGWEDTRGDADLAPMSLAALAAAREAFQDRAAFLSRYRPLLYSAFTGKAMSAGEILRGFSLVRAVSARARSARRGELPPFSQGSLGVFSSGDLAALYAQHDPAVYAAWMLSLTEGNVLLTGGVTLTDAP